MPLPSSVNAADHAHQNRRNDHFHQRSLPPTFSAAVDGNTENAGLIAFDATAHHMIRSHSLKGYYKAHTPERRQAP